LVSELKKSLKAAFFCEKMLSFQGQYELAQDLASDSDSDNLTMLQNLIRQGQRKLEAILGIYYTDTSTTFTTVTDAISGTSNQAYAIRENFRTLTDLYVTVGTTQYPAELIQDSELWRQINSTTTQSTSDFVQFCFIRQNWVELWPIPASANTATMWYRAQTKPLTAADYTTGTITTLANGSATVTGNGSTWTSAMIGRYFKINSDGEWYKISAFTSTTAITLEKVYQGVSIAAGTENYTIGQFPITPPDTHELPVWYALWKYYRFRKDRAMAKDFKRDWEEGVLEAQMNWANRSSSNVVRSGRLRGRIRNPNYYPLSLS
jgi:hypothetical protein